MTGDTSTLQAAARAYRRAERAYESRRAELAAAIVEANDAGVRQHEIVSITGYTRERIRQILKAEDERRAGHDDPGGR